MNKFIRTTTPILFGVLLAQSAGANEKSHPEFNIHQEEISKLRDKIKNNSQNIKFRNDLGIIYLKLKQYDKALTEFKNALEIDPEYSVGPFLSGSIYTDAASHQKKIDEFEEVIRVTQEHARAKNNIGLINLHLQKFGLAQKSFEEAIKINPKYAKAFNNLGVLYENLGQLAKAVENYKEASKLDADNPDILFNLAALYDVLKDGNQSLKYAQLAQKALAKRKDLNDKPYLKGQVDNVVAKYSPEPELKEKPESISHSMPQENPASENFSVEVSTPVVYGPTTEINFTPAQGTPDTIPGVQKAASSKLPDITLTMNAQPFSVIPQTIKEVDETTIAETPIKEETILEEVKKPEEVKKQVVVEPRKDKKKVEVSDWLFNYPK